MKNKLCRVLYEGVYGYTPMSEEYATEVAMLDAADVGKNNRVYIEGIGTREESIDTIYYWLIEHADHRK